MGAVEPDSGREVLQTFRQCNSGEMRCYYSFDCRRPSWRRTSSQWNRCWPPGVVRGREPTFPNPPSHCAAVDPETAGDIVAGQQPFVTHIDQVTGLGHRGHRPTGQVGPIARMSPLARMVARTSKDQGGAMTDHGTTERCPLGFRCESCGRACPGPRGGGRGHPRSNVLPHAVPWMPSERTSTSDHAQHRGEAVDQHRQHLAGFPTHHRRL